MGFYGNPMADAYNPLLANSTARLGQVTDALTAKKKRFIDLVNTGVSAAAQLKQQDMQNSAALEKAGLDNQNALDLANQKAAQELKMEEYKQKTSAQQLANFKAYVEVKKALGQEISAEDFAKWGVGLGKENNNPEITNIFSNNNTSPSISVPKPAETKVSPIPASPQQNLGKVTSRNLVKTYESYVPKPYYDKDGYAVGYGSKRDLEGKPIDPNREYSPEELQAMFERDMANSEAEVDRVVKVPLSEMQKATLASFVYNTSLGGQAFANSQLVKKLNTGDYQGAAAEMERWVHSKGKNGTLERDQGLVSRRAKEKELFLSNPPTEPSWQPIPDGPLQTPNSVSNQLPATPEQAQILANPDKIGPFNLPAMRASAERAVQAEQSDINKAAASAAKDQAEANYNNMIGGLVGGTNLAAPTTPEEAQALAEKSGLFTRRPLKDPYEELGFTNQADPSLQGGPLAPQMEEPLKYRDPSGKLIPYQPNQKLIDDRNEEKLIEVLALKAGKKTPEEYYNERKELSSTVSNLSDFRTKAKELINVLNPADMKTNIKSDTLNYLANLANSGTLKEAAIRDAFNKLPKSQQTKAVSAIFTMLGNLSAYARTKGEKGVISDVDIKRYSDLLLDVGTSPSVNREKLLNLLNDMDSLVANEFARRGMNSYANEYIEEANWVRPQLGYSSWDYRDGVGQRQVGAATTNSSGGATAGGRRRL